MEQFTNIVFACLIFLLTLFLFKAIVIALALSLGFLVFSHLFDYLKKIPAFLALIEFVFNLLVTAVCSLIIYVLIYLPFEFQITEVWLIIPKIPSLITILFIISLLIFFTLIDLRKLRQSKTFLGLLVVLVLWSGFVYQNYHQEKLKRGGLPKIYYLDKKQGFQGQIIRIKGVNLMTAGEYGKLYLGSEEMLVKSWKENLIIAEQPMPRRFGKTRLYLIRSDGVISNRMQYEIKDPGEIKSQF